MSDDRTTRLSEETVLRPEIEDDGFELPPEQNLVDTAIDQVLDEEAQGKLISADEILDELRARRGS